MHTPGSETKDKQNNPLKKWVILLSILAGVFLATTIYFGIFAKPVYNIEYVKVEQEKENLQAELDSLLAEHARIKSEYGELSEQLSEKDSVILANAEEIKKLINSQGDYKKIRKQMERLQKIAKEYVTEMDKLYQENKILKEENVQVKGELAKSQSEKAAVEKNNEDLTEKVKNAAVLRGYNISGRAVYYKSKNSVETITEKASKVEKIKVVLTIGENPLIEPGSKNIYCRISIPETGRVLTPGTSENYTFMNNGQRLQYTAKTVLNYTNKAENVTMYWELLKGNKLPKGQYTIQVFSDDALLGESFIELK